MGDGYFITIGLSENARVNEKWCAVINVVRKVASLPLLERLEATHISRYLKSIAANTDFVIIILYYKITIDGSTQCM